MQFLSDCTRFLFLLLHEAQEVETKMKVLNIISLLMERVGPAIQPHVPTLLQALPTLWAESGEQNCSLLRSIIISTLTNITKSLGGASMGLHDFILPVISLATDVKVVGHVMSHVSHELSDVCRVNMFTWQRMDFCCGKLFLHPSPFLPANPSLPPSLQANCSPAQLIPQPHPHPVARQHDWHPWPSSSLR